MKYAIIENERYARENLQKIVQQLRPDWELLFTAQSVEESVVYFKGKPDVALLFLDVELDDGSCFDILRAVKIEIPVIFTTAYNQYALKAFQLNSVDYLLKPITKESVEKALTKLESFSSHFPHDYQPLVKSVKSGPRNRILVTSGDNYAFLPVEQIAWFISEGKYVGVVQRDGHHRLTDFSNLQEVMEQLNHEVFFQLARHIVASIYCVSKVSKFFAGRLQVTLRAGEKVENITVSAARRKEFLNWLGGKHEE
ncbi:MAG: LytR/AlgR family response regulator transcription factor [Prevotella sp.]|jgi:DNA-binding LytR/AlgR family response regulator